MHCTTVIMFEQRVALTLSTSHHAFSDSTAFSPSSTLPVPLSKPFTNLSPPCQFRFLSGVRFYMPDGRVKAHLLYLNPTDEIILQSCLTHWKNAVLVDPACTFIIPVNRLACFFTQARSLKYSRPLIAS